ncbi:MAG: D-alanyl-D-alanine carboxypeptidase [Defluviitaleaceae bacterium]|nr:D-alanyl-D-alanine carboxypeptidase [Defluviitaleaceae bacterium]
MLKTIRLTFLLLFLAVVPVYAAEAPAQSTQASQSTKSGQSININAKSCLLMEANTGKILLEENSHQQLPPASVTKVMTMLLIYEALDQERIKWDQMVTTSAHAASMGGSQIFLEPEEQQSVKDLVKSIVIASANDAAVAMAEFIAGSEDAFVEMMNSKAQELGMKNTHFKNSCGLDAEGHLTTAYDIALMSQELITKYPKVFDLTKVRLDKIIHRTSKGEEEFGLTNTNRLIRNYPGTTGLKTGSTGKALYCISATAERDNMSLIAVVMGAPDPTTRFESAMKMFDYGYANYAIMAQEPSGTHMGDVTIYKGKQEIAPVVIQKQQHVLVPKGKNITIENQVKLMEDITAPVAKDTKAGEIIYNHEGTEVGRGDLVIKDEIEKAEVHDIMRRVFSRWLSKNELRDQRQQPPED